MAKREYDDECDAIDAHLDGQRSGCAGLVQRREIRATSFGTPFVTHALMCDAHAAKLGYVTAKE